MKPLKVQIPTSLKYLSKVRESINSYAEYCKISKDTAYDIVTSVDEALSNIIEHNYENRPDGVVGLELSRDKNKIVIVIEDKGTGYSFSPPDADAVKKRIDGRAKRGFGQFLIQNLSSRVRLVSGAGGGNKMVLEKDL